MFSEYLIIPGLDVTSGGPIAYGPDGAEQLVHLHQGDMDGACGPYALLMGLLSLGVVRRDDVTSWGAPNKRTSTGKLLARMNRAGSTLFREGTGLNDLNELLRGLFPNDLVVTSFAGSGTECRDFVSAHALAGHPVVLGLHGTEVAHWVLVVGLDCQLEKVNGAKREICRFLVLDPSDPPSAVSPWNGIVDARGSGGQYPYRWWTDGQGGTTKVALDTAIALAPSSRSCA